MWLNLAESTMTVPKLFCGPMKLKWNNLKGPRSTTSGTAYHDNIIPTVMLEEISWLGPVQFGIIAGMMNFQVYQKKKIFKRMSTCQLNCCRRWMRPQDWPDQSPNFDPVKILWNIGREPYQWNHQGHYGESSSAMNTLLKSSWKIQVLSLLTEKHFLPII